MKRKGDIADFFIKRHKSGPDQPQADPSPETSKPGSSHLGASQASQPSLPPPDINNDWPDLWSAKQTEDFKSKNPWLGSKNKKLGCLVCSSVNSIGINKEQGVSLSREWMNFEIQVSGHESRTTSLSVLRNKVRKHALSKAHSQAVKVAEQQKEAAIDNAMETMTESYMKETEAVFRTAYHLAKNNRPFSDHESLIELQELNGVKMGSILHSRYSATQIIQHVASEMQSKIVSSIIASSSKLAVLIDEASSLSHKAVMTVSIKASIQEESPEFIFLELVELENQRADGIIKAAENLEEAQCAVEASVALHDLGCERYFTDMESRQALIEEAAKAHVEGRTKAALDQ
ncbi:E3 SUMO-protein ligase KIAA1586-like [Melanotaenia boesemani]|uniref:E3 SUMO-protein ligase KIAA1586-like n=1 Tax=Melanotaenia boesemani TaxID=1250792 RepID=UPI001C053F91|nr:E3 SUMO-protein ligase KIAA1586-like [Melanotaenia boesemani]